MRRDDNMTSNWCDQVATITGNHRAESVQNSSGVDTSAAPGARNAPVERSRVLLGVFANYEDRWDLLNVDQGDAPVLLPPRYRDLALTERVGLPPHHEWIQGIPHW